MHIQVAEYINNAKQWKEEFKKLRSVALACGLEEEYKWKQPCYTYNGSNIVIIGGFKEFCVLAFLRVFY